MEVLLHNSSRHPVTRGLRASRPTRDGAKLFVGGRRIIRGCPVRFSTTDYEVFKPEIEKLIKQGMLLITTLDGKILNPETFQVVHEIAPPPLPAPFVDLIANDKQIHQVLTENKDAIPMSFDMPVEPPDAAVDNPILELSQEEAPLPVTPPPVVEEVKPVVEKPKVQQVFQPQKNHASNNFRRR